MSWDISKPDRWISFYNRFVGALHERADFFEISKTSSCWEQLRELTPPVAHRDFLLNRSKLNAIKDALWELLACSLDARQLGGWCDFYPFQNDAARIDRLLDDFGYPREIWYSQAKPMPRSELYAFFEFVHRLLNEVILYPSLEWYIGGKQKALCLDWFWTFDDLAFSPGDEDYRSGSGQFLETGTSPIPVSYIAQHVSADYKAYTDNLQIVNRDSRMNLRNNWEIRYHWSVYQLFEYSQLQDQNDPDSFYESIDHGETEPEIISIRENISDILIRPAKVNSWQSEIKNAASNTGDYKRRFCYCSFVPDNGAFLSENNMPELTYKYKD